MTAILALLALSGCDRQEYYPERDHVPTVVKSDDNRRMRKLARIHQAAMHRKKTRPQNLTRRRASFPSFPPAI